MTPADLPTGPQAGPTSAGFAATSRRGFLIDCARLLAGGGFTISLPALATLTACAREAADAGATFVTFAPEQVRTLTAFAEQILPSGLLSPGARDAGAVYFVDYALAGTFVADREGIIAGLEELDRLAAERSEATRFADLRPNGQVEIMTGLEGTPFFERARTLVLAGVFADPLWGGNQDRVGWELLGFQHQPTYQPPFGHYDAELLGERSEGEA